MVVLGKVYPRGKDGLLGVFKALPVALAHVTKAHGRTHARMSARTHARTHPSARMGAGAGTHTHTHIGKTPPCQKIKSPFFVFLPQAYCMMSQSYVTWHCFLF